MLNIMYLNEPQPHHGRTEKSTRSIQTLETLRIEGEVSDPALLLDLRARWTEEGLTVETPAYP